MTTTTTTTTSTTRSNDNNSDNNGGGDYVGNMDVDCATMLMCMWRMTKTIMMCDDDADDYDVARR